MAHIEIVIGPMYSGKSTELIRRCNNYEAIHKKYYCLIIHWTQDVSRIQYKLIKKLQNLQLKQLVC